MDPKVKTVTEGVLRCPPFIGKLAHKANSVFLIGISFPWFLGGQ